MSKFKKTLEELKEIADDGHLTMYLIKKTSSIEPEQMRQVVLNVDLEGEIEEYFREAINRRLNEILGDDELTICDLFSRNAMPEDILHLTDPDFVPTLPHIIDKINQSGNLESVVRFDEKTLSKLYVYAIEIAQSESERIIYFRKHTSSQRISSKGGAFIFRRGTFNKFNGELFKFDKGVDTIYYEHSGNTGMFILHTFNFENIFSFKEVYQKESKKAEELLNKSDKVELTDGLFDEIKDKKQYIKQIALLNRKGEFDKIDFDRIKKVRKKSESLQFQIKGQKIVIENKAALKDFLDVCERNILQDPVDTGQMYRARYKQEL